MYKIKCLPIFSLSTTLLTDNAALPALVSRFAEHYTQLRTFETLVITRCAPRNFFFWEGGHEAVYNVSLILEIMF